MSEQLTIDQQASLEKLERGLREFHPKRNFGQLCTEVYLILARKLCELDEPAYRRVIEELGATGTRRPHLSAEERGLADKADRRGEFGSLASRIGRLADARDATVLSLAELSARPEARPQDLRRRRSQLDSYESELVDLRAAAGRPAVELLAFGEGGDMLGPEYLGYIVARLADEEVGRLDYTYFQGEHGIRHIEVVSGRRGEGIGSALLLRLREKMPLSEVFYFGDLLSAEGRGWCEHHGIERWRVRR